MMQGYLMLSWGISPKPIQQPCIIKYKLGDLKKYIILKRLRLKTKSYKLSYTNSMYIQGFVVLFIQNLRRKKLHTKLLMIFKGYQRYNDTNDCIIGNLHQYFILSLIMYLVTWHVVSSHVGGAYTIEIIEDITAHN